MAGYTRQTTFVDAATIEAADHNNEFNQVQAAFSNTTGHSHDGTAAEGPVISVIGDAGVATPLNKVLIDTDDDRIEFWIDVSSSSTEQIYITDGVMAPTTDSDVDLGTNSLRFKDIYADTITLTTAAPVAQGGTGATTAADARTNLGVDAAGTDNSTDVTLAGTPDYITISGQQITRNQIDLTTDVTGTLPAGNGGASAASAVHARGSITSGASPAVKSGSSGVSSVSSGGTGVLNVTLSSPVTSANTAVVLASILNISFGGGHIEADMTTPTNLQIKTYVGGSSTTPFNTDVSFVVFDEV